MFFNENSRSVKGSILNSIRSNNINPSFQRSNNKLAKIITAMTKNDALAPVVALEATVVTGRTYQAYKRGKWDEARERFIEETMGSITWLCGVKVMNDIGDKLIEKYLKSNGKNFDVGTDKLLRTPFENFMRKIAPKGFSSKQVALIKFAKVLASIVITNLFIGFVVPKLNQSLTKQITHARKEEREHNIDAQKKPAFKGAGLGALNTFTNAIENTNTGKLLSSDVGIAGGRMYNARSEEERREIAIRDIGSIYFYMWASGHVGNLMNLIQSGHSTRLNPTSAGILNEYLNKVVNENGGSMTVEEFRAAVLGNPNVRLPIEKLVFEKQKLSAFDRFFGETPLEVIKLKDAQKAFTDKNIISRLKAMSELQPKRQGEAVLTKQQVIDAVNKAEINNPKLLKNVFSEFSGGKRVDTKSDKFTEYSGGSYNDEYRYISNKKLYKLKAEMEQYVNDMCKSAKGRKIDKKFLESVEKKNLTYNGINFAAGFAVSAAFLSTFIPKIQYYVTRKTTGVDAFPGTYDYKQHKQIDE